MRVGRLARKYRGQLETLAESDLWLPPEQGSCLGDIGAALHRIVDRQGLVADLAARASDRQNLARTILDGPLHRVSDVHGKMLARTREKKNARDQIGHIAEASGLGAIAIDGEIFLEQRLDHQVGDDAPIGRLQARAVGVEDAHHVGVDAVVAVVGHDEGFGESLGLIVDRTRPDRD